ncbi:DUF2235 domain-containing protein [Methylocystis parvus]|uniref:DUF2235 domain-containing protein n=1 Tax=Methylocystis parvus TaxID=134 RepID=A0A6B8M0Y9_9HYPH|nr:DUF2235 domain-containing protein [Methylocystis parvus]QGM98507.1 DUF2235 domain-containing protein [Methylocystis parvus]WBK01153.1 DUF2235 domain-containing protein [Methylocystis parvus OBBP]
MGKKIILLADGTGNGLLYQLSNIYRLCSSLDRTSKKQLVYYIPGVGTQGFKPLAMIDGATGWGVPSNVRKLHRFLSWNWEPGDAIYMFGFSRGAFTVRMLVDLIAKEGLLPTSIDGRRVSHLEMERHSDDYWRSFCAKDRSRDTNLWVWLGVRKPRDFLLAHWKRARRQPSYADIKAAAKERGPNDVPIQFVGLFDTVEAYGVPIEELRDLVHFLTIPIKFGGDHSISSNVRCVRQALSLDDERRTFHPIRVSLQQDDLDEHKAVRAPTAQEKKKPLRVDEVWFAGVHSDVGGGYPDDMTAHCPLTWMIGEAEKAADGVTSAKLAYRDKTVEGFKSVATAFGPLHDSRSGVAVLYRYAPRSVVDRDMNGHSYCRPKVHHTVVERLVDGCDDYAPLALGAAEVEMPDGSVAAAQTGDRFKTIAPPDQSETPQILKGDEPRELARAQYAMNKLDAPDREEMDSAQRFVWLNTQVYVAAAAAVVVAILLLLHGHWIVALLALPILWALSVLKEDFSDKIRWHARKAWSVQDDKQRDAELAAAASAPQLAENAAE